MGIAAEKRRERQRTQVRRAILQAAEALLVEGGHEGFSMRRLAARCGYTVPTVYHHFGDKSGLLNALLEERYGQLTRRLRRVVRGHDPEEDVREVISDFVRFSLANPSHYRLIMSQPPTEANPPAHEAEARALLEVPLEQLRDEGRLRVENRELAIQVISSMLHGLIQLQTSWPDYDWTPELLETSIDTLLTGLLRPRAQRSETA